MMSTTTTKSRKVEMKEEKNRGLERERERCERGGQSWQRKIQKNFTITFDERGKGGDDICSEMGKG